MDDLLADVPMQSWLGDQVYLPAEQVLEVHEQTAEVEQTPAGLHIDEEIHVAGLIRLALGDRSEDADVRRPMLGGQRQDGVPLVPDDFRYAHERCHGGYSTADRSAAPRARLAGSARIDDGIHVGTVDKSRLAVGGGRLSVLGRWWSVAESIRLPHICACPVEPDEGVV